MSSDSDPSSGEVGPGEARGRARGVRPGLSWAARLICAWLLLCGSPLGAASAQPGEPALGARPVAAEPDASDRDRDVRWERPERRSPAPRAADLRAVDEDAIAEAEEREPELSSASGIPGRGPEHFPAAVLRTVRHRRIGAGRRRRAHGPRAPPGARIATGPRQA